MMLLSRRDRGSGSRGDGRRRRDATRRDGRDGAIGGRKGGPSNDVSGANIAGFMKVSDATLGPSTWQVWTWQVWTWLIWI
jgi:hypothetical protein